LPASGKSTLVAELARRLPLVVLSKDAFEEALFASAARSPPGASRDSCMPRCSRPCAPVVPPGRVHRPIDSSTSRGRGSFTIQ
jgi:AAA domain